MYHHLLLGWKPTPSWVKGSPWQLFHQTHVRLGNDTTQPSTQQASSIQSTHGKYNPSRALVNGFCLLSTNIVAFSNCFWLNWSGMSDQSISFASLSSFHGHTRQNRLAVLPSLHLKASLTASCGLRLCWCYACQVNVSAGYWSCGLRCHCACPLKVHCFRAPCTFIHSGMFTIHSNLYRDASNQIPQL